MSRYVIAPLPVVSLSAVSLRVAPLLAGALLVGCAADKGAYPSLAPRPIETTSLTEPPQPQPGPVAPDPALDARIAEAVRACNAAAAAFDTDADRAERMARAARGEKAGSDRWLDAQTALADLDSRRGAYTQAIDPLEDLASAHAQALQPAYPALEAALTRVRATAEAQTRRIDALTAMLAPA